MTGPRRSKPVGRGAAVNPPNRFDRLRLVDEVDPTCDDSDRDRLATQFIVDESKSAVTENNSPDIEFRYALNPYRGCEHGCSYCYARTYHEYLGFSGGLDFETKIVYKPKIAEHFRTWLSRSNYRPEKVTLSGATDCYQPAERQYELTRSCLKTALEFRQPLSIVTKNALVLRDLDLIAEMASQRLIHVQISITSLDQSLTRILEPRTSSPAARLRAMKELVDANVPTRALLSPMIPGLNDSELPNLLRAVSEAGVTASRSTLLRLPGVVQSVFLSWLREELPNQADRIESRIRQTRNEKLTDGRFNSRMRGEGVIADQIQQTYRVFAKKFGVDQELPELNFDTFRRPDDHQLRLF